MSGPALLLLGFAVTGRPGTGSGLLASLTIAGAAGRPPFAALPDRSRRPGRGADLGRPGRAGGALGLPAVAVPAGRPHRDRPRSGGTAPDTGPADGRGVRGHRGQAPAAAGHCDLGGVLRRHRYAPGLLPAARRAAPRRGSPRRAADQRDPGRLADRPRDPGPLAWSPPAHAPLLLAARHLGARPPAGER